jgi:hypothetical protein
MFIQEHVVVTYPESDAMTATTGFLVRVVDGPAEGYQVHTNEKPDRTLTLALLPKGWHPVQGKKEWPVNAIYERAERRMVDGQIVYPYMLKTAKTESPATRSTGRVATPQTALRSTHDPRGSSVAMAIRSRIARLFHRAPGQRASSRAEQTRRSTPH